MRLSRRFVVRTIIILIFSLKLLDIAILLKIRDSINQEAYNQLFKDVLDIESEELKLMDSYIYFLFDLNFRYDKIEKTQLYFISYEIENYIVIKNNGKTNRHWKSIFATYCLLTKHERCLLISKYFQWYPNGATLGIKVPDTSNCN